MLHQGVCTAALNKPNRIYNPGPFYIFSSRFRGRARQADVVEVLLQINPTCYILN